MTSSVRHDWYQTDEKVVITVLIKNALKYNVDIEPMQVSLTADDYSLDLLLYKEINKEKSSHKITPIKVEITLAKLVGERWPSLTAPEKAAEPNVLTKVAKIYKQDWDTLEKEIEKEEPKDVNSF